MIEKVKEKFQLETEEAKEKLNILKTNEKLYKEFESFMETGEIVEKPISIKYKTIKDIKEEKKCSTLDGYLELVKRNKKVFELEDIEFSKIYKTLNLETIPDRYYNAAYKVYELSTSVTPISETYIKLNVMYDSQKFVDSYNGDKGIMKFNKNSLELNKKTSHTRNLQFVRYTSDCSEAFNHIFLATYMKLMETVKNKEYIDKCRNIYKNNKFKNDKIHVPQLNFSLKIPKLEISTKLLDFLVYLIDNGYFYLERDLIKNKITWTMPTIFADKNTNKVYNLYKEGELNNELCFSEYTRDYVKNDYLTSKTNSENINISIMLIFIDALIRTGKYEEYYNEIKEEEIRLEKELLAFREKKGINEKLKKIIDRIQNKNTLTINGVIIGNERTDVKKMSLIIKQEFEKSEKVFETEVCTLQQLSTKLTSLEGQKYIYNDMEKNKLFFLTGIEACLKDLKSNSLNIYQKKAYDYLFKILSRYEDNKYIYVLGDKVDVNNFLKLDKKLEFLFSENKIELEDLSSDEIYDIYKEYLSNELKINLNDKFKEEFKNYYLLNNSYFPIKNSALAKYLAKYAIEKNKLVLPENLYKDSKEELSKIIGLNSVKEQIKEFEQYVQFIQKAKDVKIKIPKTNMHMLFTGNPGTGKTTIARIIAKILYQIGVIKENKFIEVSRKDLVGEWSGQTGPKTQAVIDEAMGGVLFIDEAYALCRSNNDSLGNEAVATLIKAMEDNKDKFVVIFAGYKDEMKQFIDTNAGIASRIGYTFDFPDYNEKELTEIFNRKMMQNGFIIEDDVLKEVEHISSIFMKRKNFGNGRFIDKLIQETIIIHSKQYENEINRIILSDLPSLEQLNNESTQKEDLNLVFDNLIGLNSLKEQIREFASYITFSKKARNEGLNLPTQNMHMLFTGNPGTGKTTVARLIAKMLFDLDVLHENKLVEVERKDLVAEYIGQTAPKTTEVIEKAMGGVLFIDEAYSLTPADSFRDFGQEAVSTLIKAMEDHKGEFIVIFAGYKDEMKHFVDSNAGIASRIGYTFDFTDYNAEELLQIFELKIKKSGFELSEDAKIAALKIMKYFYRVENIGNGRFADRIVQNTIINHAKNSLNSENIKIISQESIPSVNEIIKNLSNGSELLSVNKIDEKSLKKTAIHEIGHAYLRYKLYQDPQIIKITINPEGCGTLGYVEHKVDNKATHSKTEFLNQIKILLAGMASEELFNNEFESGNGSDLQKATSIAHNMITRYGMSDLGYAQISNKEEMSKEIYIETNKILKECFDEAKKILSENKEEVTKLIDYLLSEKEITGEKFIEEVKK